MTGGKKCETEEAPWMLQGRSSPLGATPFPGGVNFSLFSWDCSALELLLFDGVEDPAPSRIIRFDPRFNRTYHYWHLFVPGVGPGQLYGYRAAGPEQPRPCHRFDPEKLLFDPYGRALALPSGYRREAATAPGRAGNGAAGSTPRSPPLPTSRRSPRRPPSKVTPTSCRPIRWRLRLPVSMPRLTPEVQLISPGRAVRPGGVVHLIANSCRKERLWARA